MADLLSKFSWWWSRCKVSKLSWSCLMTGPRICSSVIECLPMMCFLMACISYNLSILPWDCWNKQRNLAYSTMPWDHSNKICLNMCDVVYVAGGVSAIECEMWTCFYTLLGIQLDICACESSTFNFPIFVHLALFCCPFPSLGRAPSPTLRDPGFVWISWSSPCTLSPWTQLILQTVVYTRWTTCQVCPCL